MWRGTLELFVDGEPEVALDKICAAGGITIREKVVYGKRRGGIEDVVNTEGDCRISQKIASAPARAFRCRGNRFFANDSFSFFIITRLRCFGRYLDRRTNFIGDLPVQRRPIPDGMDVPWDTIVRDKRSDRSGRVSTVSGLLKSSSDPT